MSSKAHACARRDGAPTAPPPPSARARGSSPAAHRPPAPPAPCPNPGPATGADPHPGHTRAPCGRSGHSGATPRFAAAPAPPPARRRQPPPRRTRCPRSPCAYRHPTAHAITSHCARRCPLLRFLTLDKPETLSDNDVRLFRPQTHPRNVSEEPQICRVITRRLRRRPVRNGTVRSTARRRRLRAWPSARAAAHRQTRPPPAEGPAVGVQHGVDRQPGGEPSTSSDHCSSRDRTLVADETLASAHRTRTRSRCDEDESADRSSLCSAQFVTLTFLSAARLGAKHAVPQQIYEYLVNNRHYR